MSTPAATRPPRTWQQTAVYLARRAVTMEIGSYLSIYRYVCRRPKVPPGAVGFTYHQPVLVVVIAFILLSAVELVVFDLLVRRWGTVRLTLLVVGVWGLVWMFGLLFGMLTRPHAVGPEGIRVRSGTEIDIPLSWQQVSSVSGRKTTEQEKQPQVTFDDAGRATLHLRVQNETNLEIELARSVEVKLPQGRETITRLHLYADEPQAFLGEVSRHR